MDFLLDFKTIPKALCTENTRFMRRFSVFLLTENHISHFDSFMLENRFKNCLIAYHSAADVSDLSGPETGKAICFGRAGGAGIGTKIS